jgi:hypothetical protein
MRCILRRISVATLLSLQLLLATRGFVWMVPSPTVVSVDEGSTRASPAVHEHGASDASTSAEHEQAPNTPCHDPSGCHASTPCCAPALADAPVVALEALAIVDIPRPHTARVAVRTTTRTRGWQPPSTAPPALR